MRPLYKNPWYWLGTLLVLIPVTLWTFGVFNVPKPGNPLCTPAAAQQFNDYWQQQISQADYSDMNQVLNAAMTATAHRNQICGG